MQSWRRDRDPFQPLELEVERKKIVEDGFNEVEEQVSDLFGKLNLTTREKETLVLQDNEDSDLAGVKYAVIGKVLSPNLLHLQTIMSAMRPAWGNPRGLR